MDDADDVSTLCARITEKCVNKMEAVESILFDRRKPFGYGMMKLFADYHSVSMSKEVQKYLCEKSIQFESSPPCEHAQYMIESCAVKPPVRKTQVMLVVARFAILEACEVINMLPGSEGDPQSPHEKVTDKKPDVSLFRPMCRCPVLNHDAKEERQREFDPRWTERTGIGVLIGYFTTVPGEYLILTSKRQMLTRENVIVQECMPEEVRTLYFESPKTSDRLIDGEGQPDERTETGKRVRPRSQMEPMVTRGAVRAALREADRSVSVESALRVPCRRCAANTPPEPEPDPPPTAHSALVNMVMHIGAAMGFEMLQFDGSAAYLESPAQHTQYMRMTDDLIEFGLTQLKEEPRLFYLNVTEKGGEVRALIVLLFSDDGMYIGNWPEKMREFEGFLQVRLGNVMLSKVSKYLGVDVVRDPDKHAIEIPVRPYERDLIRKYETTWPGPKVTSSLLRLGGATPHVMHTTALLRKLRGEEERYARCDVA